MLRNFKIIISIVCSLIFLFLSSTSYAVSYGDVFRKYVSSEPKVRDYLLLTIYGCINEGQDYYTHIDKTLTYESAANSTMVDSSVKRCMILAANTFFNDKDRAFDVEMSRLAEDQKIMKLFYNCAYRAFLEGYFYKKNYHYDMGQETKEKIALECFKEELGKYVKSLRR